MDKKDRIAEFGDLWREYAPMENDYLIVGNLPLITYLNENFFTSPASTKYHGAYEGGLYDHSKQVFLRLKALTEKNTLKWQRDESPFIIGMFHDLCKCDQYVKVIDNSDYVSDGKGMLVPEEKCHYEYNNKTLLKGHAPKSLMILSQFINLTEEEMLCIRFHMGAFEIDDWDEFGKAIKKYPNVLWTHHADMLASKVDGI